MKDNKHSRLSINIYVRHNWSSLMLKRLLRDVKLWVAVLSALAILFTTVYVPAGRMSGLAAMAFLVLLLLIFGLDIILLKNRSFELCVLNFFIFFIMYMIWSNTFGNLNVGVMMPWSVQ